MSKRLTPYTTGEVAEPHLWVQPGNAASLDLAVNPHADELRANYGRVDFDDDEGRTIATVKMTRREDGGYTLRVESFDDDLMIEEG